MLPLLAILLTIGTVAGPPGRPPSAVAVVPPEPEALVLDDPATLQAVVADLDGTGAPVLVRLVQDAGGAVLVDAWRHHGLWRPVREPLEVVPAGGNRFDVAFDATPSRLIVRRVGDRERVTLVRQPQFEPPGLEPECCLQLHDVLVDDDGRARLVAVGSAREAVDAILAIDLDGDGTDELLASRSLPPLGRTAYPSEVLVYRWSGDRFATPVLTELPIGSGNTPFVLGESDGRPGEEAGIIGTAAQSRLSRLVLDDGDRVRAESAGAAVSDVAAVDLDGSPGVAVLGPMAGLSVHRWPAGEPLGPPLATQPIRGGRIVGTVGSVVVVERTSDAAIERYELPGLRFVRGPGASGAAGLVTEATSLRPYRGPSPGGAVLVDGTLLGGDSRTGSGTTAALVDAMPIGLVGPDRRWMAVGHGMSADHADPRGGRLQPVSLPMAGTVALVPADSVLTPEVDEGAFDPPISDAFVLDESGTLGVGAAGFSVSVEAPPGSRVQAGPSSSGPETVPADGRLDLRLPPAGSTGDGSWVAVVTPAGATYVARWDVIALTEAPPLIATSRTPLGSTAVEVSGESVPYAQVTVDGHAAPVDERGRFSSEVDAPPWPTEVEVLAVDPAGNATRATLTVVGLLDYRALPWIPIILGLLALVAAVLYVRAPRPAPAAAGLDDATLEEIDPEPDA